MRLGKFDESTAGEFHDVPGFMPLGNFLCPDICYAGAVGLGPTARAAG